MAKAENRCPECGVFVKRENLPSHMRKAHAMSEEAARLEREIPRSHRHVGSRPFPLWLVLLVVLLSVAGSGAFLAYRYASPAENGTTPLSEMCVQHSGLGIHSHAHLSITILGTPSTIPANIGIVSNACYRPLHTHEADGTIHIELPGPRTVYLRDFFAIWGQPFSLNQVLSYASDATHEVVMFVGGVPSAAYENMVLQDGQSISIEYRVR